MIKRVVALIAAPIVFSVPPMEASPDKSGIEYIASSQEMVKNQEKILFLLQEAIDQLKIAQQNIGQSDLKTEMALDTIWMVLEQIQEYQVNGSPVEFFEAEIDPARRPPPKQVEEFRKRIEQYYSNQKEKYE